MVQRGRLIDRAGLDALRSGALRPPRAGLP
jgi:hypothetical protein